MEEETKYTKIQLTLLCKLAEILDYKTRMLQKDMSNLGVSDDIHDAVKLINLIEQGV